jgi:hypothetical protein
LLPFRLLLKCFGPGNAIRLTVEKIEKASAQTNASMMLVIMRLGEAVAASKVELLNAAFSATIAESRKKHTDPAPRIFTRCFPGRWFVPANTRLASLGLTTLHETFYSVPLYGSIATNDSFQAWDRITQKTSRIDCRSLAKCYEWIDRRGDGGLGNRLMISVLNFELQSSI